MEGWTRFFVLFSLTLMPTLALASDPDAGLATSWTDDAIVSVSSNSATAANVVDGDRNTNWQSGGCLPIGFYARPDLNLLLGAGAAGSFTASGVVNVENATDGASSTPATVQLVSGEAWIEFEIAVPQIIRDIGVYIYLSSPGTITVTANTATGSTVVGTVTNVDNNTPVRFSAPAEAVTSIRLSSDVQFLLKEVATLSESCFETVTLDLGQLREIGWVITRHWAGGKATSTTLLASADSISWTELADLDPAALNEVTTRLDVPVMARYLRVRHDLVEQDYAKVFFWEIDAYDANGLYGSPADVAVNPHTMAELLGVNGIWGWATNTWSDQLDSTRGPLLYQRVASHARNYENMNWDVTDPDTPPDFDNMPGSLAQTWLDWDREYSAWKAAGLDIAVTIKMRTENFPTSAWDDPYNSAYEYGRRFADHFGSTVSILEVGNEPWDHPEGFYRAILKGMADGAKAGDPNMFVLPAAFQATTPDPDTTSGNYIGTRVLPSIASNIDALNIHAYSFAHESDGTRIAVNPEHPESETHSVRNMRRFRDANFPGLPIYLTEWGWDSDGAGEPATGSEKVSEYAQALYAVRGALMFAREGMDKITWYFFANTTSSSGLFGRSGLTGSKNTDFELKQSFTALEAFVNTLGDRHFVDVLQEDDQAWVYLLGDADGTPSHVVAWKPLDVDREPLTTSTVSVAAPGTPGNAWTLEGLSPTGEPVASPGSWSIEVSAVPLVVEILAGPGSIQGTVSDEVGSVAGVTVDLYRQNAGLVASTSTASDGTYSFPDQDPDSYTVEMVTPIGYLQISPAQVDANVEPLADTIVDFQLQRKTIVLDTRGSGYWKHQVNTLIKGKGNAHETESAMLSYLADIKQFWNYFDGLSDDLAGLQTVLDLPQNPAMKARAEKELMSLLLNITSEKIATFTEVSADDNVDEAVTYIILSLQDAGGSYEQAKDIAEAINNGNTPIDAELIPENLSKSSGDVGQLPHEFALQQNHPNPFNPETRILFQLPAASQVRIQIFNVRGELIQTLTDKIFAAGYHSLSWNGKDDSGKAVASGLYVYALEAGTFHQVRKMMLIR